MTSDDIWPWVWCWPQKKWVYALIISKVAMGTQYFQSYDNHACFITFTMLLCYGHNSNDKTIYRCTWDNKGLVITLTMILSCHRHCDDNEYHHKCDAMSMVVVWLTNVGIFFFFGRIYSVIFNGMANFIYTIKTFCWILTPYVVVYLIKSILGLIWQQLCS